MRPWLCALALLGCSETSTFTVGRDLEICEGNVPTACAVTGRCVLDDAHYLEGTFPGSRRFIVRTEGEATLRFELFLYERKNPGTELRVVAYEPACADRTIYDSAGQDVFRVAASDGILRVELRVTRPGDHLIELSSDAYCRYALKVDYD